MENANINDSVFVRSKLRLGKLDVRSRNRLPASVLRKLECAHGYLIADFLKHFGKLHGCAVAHPSRACLAYQLFHRGFWKYHGYHRSMQGGIMRHWRHPRRFSTGILLTASN